MGALLVIVVAIVAAMMGARSERFRRARADVARTKASIGGYRKNARSEVGKTVTLVVVALIVIIIATHGA
jgi:hypothetical protein